MRFWLVERNKLCGAVILGCALILVLAFAARSGVGFGVQERETATGESERPASAVVQEAVETSGAGGGASAVEDYYVECRLERERARGKQVELLRSIVNDPHSGPEARQNAQDRLLQISLELDREVSVENILRAKGLSEAAVFFQNEMVTVVVPHAVGPEQSATVVNLVARATGMQPENILVIARND